MVLFYRNSNKCFLRSFTEYLDCPKIRTNQSMYGYILIMENWQKHIFETVWPPQYMYNLCITNHVAILYNNWASIRKFS